MPEGASENSPRPRVLVIAEAANPDWVSVPLVGWSLASALREVADVHLVTQIRNQEAIAATGLRTGEEVTYIDSEPVARPMYKLAELLRMGTGKGWTMTTAAAALAYPYFEHLVWRRFGAALREGAYDLVHRVTPLSPTMSSVMAPRCAAAGVPFLLGPLNGGVPWPKGFDSERRREREWLSYIRDIYKLSPGRARTQKAASAILVGSRHTQSEILARHQHKTVYIPENAIDPERFNLRAAQDVSGQIRACFIGRMVPYKGPDMLLEAAASELRAGRLVLDMIGDGPMLEGLKAQADTLGVAASVTFHGNLPHGQVQHVAARANLLAFPSVREFGGGVVLEAMALGVVPLVVDYAGPGELVSPELGYSVPIGSRAEIVEAFQTRLQAICDDPSPLPGLAEAAYARAQSHFTWSAKAQQVRQVYDWVLAGGAGPAPQFFDPVPRG